MQEVIRNELDEVQWKALDKQQELDSFCKQEFGELKNKADVMSQWYAESQRQVNKCKDITREAYKNISQGSISEVKQALQALDSELCKLGIGIFSIYNNSVAAHKQSRSEPLNLFRLRSQDEAVQPEVTSRLRSIQQQAQHDQGQLKINITNQQSSDTYNINEQIAQQHQQFSDQGDKEQQQNQPQQHPSQEVECQTQQKWRQGSYKTKGSGIFYTKADKEEDILNSLLSCSFLGSSSIYYSLAEHDEKSPQTVDSDKDQEDLQQKDIKNDKDNILQDFAAFSIPVDGSQDFSQPRFTRKLQTPSYFCDKPQGQQQKAHHHSPLQFKKPQTKKIPQSKLSNLYIGNRVQRLLQRLQKTGATDEEMRTWRLDLLPLAELCVEVQRKRKRNVQQISQDIHCQSTDKNATSDGRSSDDNVKANDNKHNNVQFSSDNNNQVNGCENEGTVHVIKMNIKENELKTKSKGVQQGNQCDLNTHNNPEIQLAQENSQLGCTEHDQTENQQGSTSQERSTVAALHGNFYKAGATQKEFVIKLPPSPFIHNSEHSQDSYNNIDRTKRQQQQHKSSTRQQFQQQEQFGEGQPRNQDQNFESCSSEFADRPQAPYRLVFSKGFPQKCKEGMKTSQHYNQQWAHKYHQLQDKDVDNPRTKQNVSQCYSAGNKRSCSQPESTCQKRQRGCENEGIEQGQKLKCQKSDAAKIDRKRHFVPNNDAAKRKFEQLQKKGFYVKDFDAQQYNFQEIKQKFKGGDVVGRWQPRQYYEPIIEPVHKIRNPKHEAQKRSLDLDQRTRKRVQMYHKHVAGQQKQADSVEQMRGVIQDRLRRGRLSTEGPLWQVLYGLRRYDPSLVFNTHVRSSISDLKKARKEAMSRLHPDRHVKSSKNKRILYEELFKIVSALDV